MPLRLRPYSGRFESSLKSVLRVVNTKRTGGKVVMHGDVIYITHQIEHEVRLTGETKVTCYSKSLPKGLRPRHKVSPNSRFFQGRRPFRFAFMATPSTAVPLETGSPVFFQFIERKPRGGSAADGRGYSAGSLFPTESAAARTVGRLGERSPIFNI